MIDIIADYHNNLLNNASIEFLLKHIQDLHKKYNFNVWQESYFYDKRDWEAYYRLTERNRMLWKIAELEYIAVLMKRKRI